jgi:carboxyl-terminal processing protease
MEDNGISKYGFVKGLICGLAIMFFVSGTVTAIYLNTQQEKNRSVEDILSDEKMSTTKTQSLLSESTEIKVETLSEIINLYYYDDTDKKALEEGIYAGLLQGLKDPYSQYYTADEYASLQEGTNGVYYGIGAVLSQNYNTMAVSILHVYDGTPAQQAGIKDGDVILKVGDVDGSSMELSKLVQLIKGDEGTKVHLSILREGEQKELEFDVERKKIEVPTIESQLLSDQTGLVQITEFSEVTAEQFSQAVKELQAQGANSLIIDLRDNPGGLMESVCAILDEILPKGVLVYTEDKYGERQDYTSKEKSVLEMPIAVLINENSASASEIFAGAIKDFKYGTLIGTKTFGKGIVQQILPLNDGSAVKVTVAKYFTPKGNYIHEVGIEPDIKLEYKYLDKNVKDDSEYNPKFDNQIQKALEILNK